MITPPPIPHTSYPPPVTLSAPERAILESLPPAARAKFEAVAVDAEFCRGQSLDQSEAEALATVIRLFMFSPRHG